MTAADVAFTLETLKQKGHPRYQLALRDVASAAAIDPATVKYQFKGENLRDLPTLVATLPVFSKAYYTANDFLKESLEPPLGPAPTRSAISGREHSSPTSAARITGRRTFR